MKQALIISIFCCSIAVAFAGVDLRNGAFYMVYADAELGSSKAEITRNYNSQNTGSGMFGYGWSTFIATTLTALPDGAIVIRWWGSGWGDYYAPAVTNRKGLYSMIDAIIADALLSKKLENEPAAIAERRATLAINDKERAGKYQDLLLAKKVQPYVPPAGSRLSWRLDVNQTVHWNGQHFQVKNWHRSYLFNTAGQLLQANETDYFLKLEYASGKLAALHVDDLYHCRVQTDSAGHITAMEYQDSSGLRRAAFAYDTNDNLVYSKDMGDNEYRYSYDRRHNMVRIDYTDHTFLGIQYDAVTNRVSSLQAADGKTITYAYPYFYTAAGKIDDDHYATNVQTFDSLGKLLFTDYREYEHRNRDDGSSYLYRLYEKSDTSLHEVIYEPNVANAVYRKLNDRIARAAYDEKKLCTYLFINDTIYRSTYTSTELPLTFVAKDSTTGKTEYFLYSYNSAGKLVRVYRNNLAYTIKGSRDEDSIAIAGNNKDLVVYFEKGRAVALESEDYGFMMLDEDRQQLADSLLKNGKNESVAMLSANDRKYAAKQQAAAAATQHGSAAFGQFQTKLDRTGGRTGTKATRLTAPECREKLLALYQELQHVMEARYIHHEWIWERL